MPYPTKYTRQYDFASYQNSNPTRPLPGSKVNIDLDSAKLSIGEIIDFLKGVVRSDGKLANGSVGVDQLNPNLNLGFSLPTVWEPRVDYTADSTVLYANKFWKAKVAHTSTDGFDESKWDEIVDFGAQATSAAASAAAASVSEGNAASSESAALGYANAAGGSESAASAYANTASTKANEAAASAGVATTQAGLAGASFAAFDKRFLGAKSVDPITDNTGAALVVGALYWNEVDNALKFYDGSGWIAYNPTGDMVASVYDTGGVHANAFDSANHTFIHGFVGAVSRPALAKMRDAWSVFDAGAVGNGVVDDSPAFKKLADAGLRVIVPPGDFRFETPVALSDGSQFEGFGPAVSKILAAADGQHLFQAIGKSKVGLSGLSLEGTTSGVPATTTIPGEGGDGYGDPITGLAHFNTCTDVLIDDCELSKFNYTVSQMFCERTVVRNAYVHNFKRAGAQISGTRKWRVLDNVIVDSDETGAKNSYGVAATGGPDTDLTKICSDGWLINNYIGNIPSWDGFMTHGARNLRLVGNRMKNVRTGFDISHYDMTDDLTIALNSIEGPTSDPWAGASAFSGGVKFSTDSGSRAPTNGDLIVVNNRIKGFYNVAGLVGGGTLDVVSITDADRTIMQGNIITDCGAQASVAGVGIYGTHKVVSLQGGIIDGKFAAGGIRTAGATVGDLIVDGHSIKQTTASDIGVYIDSGSAIGNLALGGNPTNSTTPVLITGTVSKYSGAGHPLSASASYAGGAFAAGAVSGVGSISVPGAAMGDLFTKSFSGNLQGMTLNVWQTAAGSFSFQFVNNTSGSLTLAAGTVRVRVLKGA